MARGIISFLERCICANHYHQDPNSPEGRSIARIMTSTSMMAVVGLLENISASKAAVEKKAKDQKESVEKASVLTRSHVRTY
jgi:hypothetical protein